MNTPWYNLKADPAQHELAWPSVLSYRSARNLFPNLTKLRLEILDEKSSISYDWVTLFIAPTLAEIQLQTSSRPGRETTRALDSIMSKCLDLQRIDLSVYGPFWSWDGVANSPVPQSLRSFKIFEGTIGSSFLSWAGRMPELEILDLQPYEWRSRQETTLLDIDLPPDSFPSLRFLNFENGSINLLANLCLTPIVSYLTKLTVKIYISEGDSVTTSQLFVLLATHIPSLQDLECHGPFDPTTSGISSLYPLPLHRLKLSGSFYAGPELSMTTISGLPPTLKVLELNNFLSLQTIMHLPLHYLRLEVLHVCINPLAIPSAIDSSHLSGSSLEGIRTIWRSHPFTLKLDFDQWEYPEVPNLDICAKYVQCVILFSTH